MTRAGFPSAMMTNNPIPNKSRNFPSLPTTTVHCIRRSNTQILSDSSCTTVPPPTFLKQLLATNIHSNPSDTFCHIHPFQTFTSDALPPSLSNITPPTRLSSSTSKETENDLNISPSTGHDSALISLPKSSIASMVVPLSTLSTEVTILPTIPPIFYPSQTRLDFSPREVISVDLPPAFPFLRNTPAPSRQALGAERPAAEVKILSNGHLICQHDTVVDDNNYYSPTRANTQNINFRHSNDIVSPNYSNLIAATNNLDILLVLSNKKD